MAEYGICKLSFAPGRGEASDRSEMTHQLLFGEPYCVHETGEKWVKVETLWDGYLCWLDHKQHFPVDGDFAQSIYNEEYLPRCSSLIGYAYGPNDQQVLIPMGSPLPRLKNDEFELNGEKWNFNGEVAETNSDQISSYAMRLLNTPYLWGGRSTFGLDCSGFIQMIFSLAGIKLPRDAWQQAKEGEPVGFGKHEVNDLVYFQNEIGRIMHVGIMLDRDKILHASGRVRIDQLTGSGITTSEGKLTHRFHSMRRV